MRKENLYKLLTIVFAIGFLIMSVVALSPKKILGGSVHNTQEIFTAGIRTLSANDFEGGSVLAGDNFITNIIGEGSYATTSPATTTVTLTAAQICDNTLISVNPTVGAVTATLPTSDLLLADCLPTVGDMKTVNFWSVGSSTTLAAGSGGTLGYSSSTTISADKYAKLSVIRTSATAYLALFSNFNQ